MKPLLWLLLLTIPVSAQTLEYDKFTDTSSYKSKRIEVYRSRGGLLVYNPARVMVQTVKIVGKPDLRMLLTVDSFDWQFTRSCVIRFLADDKRYEYQCEVLDSNAYSLARDVYVQEYLGILIPPSDFRSILQAKIIEAQVGAYQFKLKEKHTKELLKADVPEITTGP